MRRILPLLSLCCPVLAQSYVVLPKELPLHTKEGERVPYTVPRPEHPRPQLVRERWLSLNGPWEFARGREEPFSARILVPFAPECALSGLFLRQEVLERCRYRRTFRVPKEWSGQRVLIHFEAVDWEAEVFVDGKRAGGHRGGYDRFTFDLTELLAAQDEHELRVDVFDPSDPRRGGFQPRGKQLGSNGIWYTRTTGIWRSVWLEAVGDAAIAELETRADHTGRLGLRVALRSGSAPGAGWRLRGRVSGKGGDGKPLACELEGSLDTFAQPVQVAGAMAWSPESPSLYDLDLDLVDARGVVRDHVQSQVAFRSVGVSGKRWCLNGKPYSLRGVLDQGYWPEGGLTAPTDAALRQDVQLLKDLGLNLARKHVKVEDARWYHWCDRLGLLVMQDMPSSMNLGTEPARANFDRELEAVVTQLRVHPCIVHWVVFNEDWGHPGAFQDACVQRVRALDPTRPVTDASGWTQRGDTDVIDVHDYGQDLLRHGGVPADGKPRLLGECGGVAFSLPGHTWTAGWGYTQAKSADSFIRRVADLTRQATDAQDLSGFVWTQLSDVEQELNGLVHYDRTPKVEAGRLAGALSGRQPAQKRIAPDSWQVLGPLPSGTDIKTAANDEANRAQLTRALAREFVGDEAHLRARDTPLTIDGEQRAWRSVAAPRQRVDLAPEFPGAVDCVAYAVGSLRCAVPLRLRMLFGSDDAAQVWLDGKPIHTVVAVRGTQLGEDEVEPLELAAGEHQIVVKVAQGVGGYGFALCFEEAQ